ncbi:unnamed protein product [marine sediment metagenome]|uniref:Uncharacterized protein n=1 Tax=marine sediment metagenome TaxID=412755 RepID=X0YFR2_9ZZZZ
MTMTKTDLEFIETRQTLEDMICPHDMPLDVLGFECDMCPYEQECSEVCSDYVGPGPGNAGPDACNESCGEDCCGGAGGTACCGGEDVSS